MASWRNGCTFGGARAFNDALWSAADEDDDEDGGMKQWALVDNTGFRQSMYNVGRGLKINARYVFRLWNASAKQSKAFKRICHAELTHQMRIAMQLKRKCFNEWKAACINN